LFRKQNLANDSGLFINHKSRIVRCYSEEYFVTEEVFIMLKTQQINPSGNTSDM
jgi:hypothetical protein